MRQSHVGRCSTGCWISNGDATRLCRLEEVGEAHALVRSEAMLATRLRSLAHALSDASLSGEQLQHLDTEPTRRRQPVVLDLAAALQNRMLEGTEAGGIVSIGCVCSPC